LSIHIFLVVQNRACSGELKTVLGYAAVFCTRNVHSYEEISGMRYREMWSVNIVSVLRKRRTQRQRICVLVLHLQVLMPALPRASWSPV
jgi:hypothetical protein